MPYFLNDPASMATNKGACRSETAGTATLMIFGGVSAENIRATGDSKKTIGEMRVVHRFIGCSFPLKTSITPRAKKCPVRSCDRAEARRRLVFRYKLLRVNYDPCLTGGEPTCVIKTYSRREIF